MRKVLEINLERNLPTVDAALRTLQDGLTTCRKQGIRAAILIHGYGSTGVGGSIRTAVRRRLGEPALCGTVRDVAYGEQWHWNKKKLLSICKDLEEYESRIANNEGVTVVILK